MGATAALVGACVYVCALEGMWGWGGGGVMEKGKNREKGKEESHVVFKNE